MFACWTLLSSIKDWRASCLRLSRRASWWALAVVALPKAALARLPCCHCYLAHLLAIGPLLLCHCCPSLGQRLGLNLIRPRLGNYIWAKLDHGRSSLPCIVRLTHAGDYCDDTDNRVAGLSRANNDSLDILSHESTSNNYLPLWWSFCNYWLWLFGIARVSAHIESCQKDKYESIS